MSELKDFCCVCVKKYPHLENINESDENAIKYKEKLSLCTKEQVLLMLCKIKTLTNRFLDME